MSRYRDRFVRWEGRRVTEVTEVSVGRQAPAFELPDEQNQPWNLSGNLELGPVMLVFYRGDW
jgi:peroxiredoxin